MSKLYSPLVYRWAREGGLQASDAADIVQEVFRTVAIKIDSFEMDHERASFRGWLWTITRNQVRLAYRKQQNRPKAMGGSTANQDLQQYPDILDQEDEPSKDDSRLSLVHRALNLVRQDFSEQTWKAFWAVTIEEHSATEVAERVGMKPSAVRQAKYRVLTRLREQLECS